MELGQGLYETNGVGQRRDEFACLYHFSKVVKEIVHYFQIEKNSETLAITPASCPQAGGKLSLLSFSRIGIRLAMSWSLTTRLGKNSMLISLRTTRYL